MLLSIVTGFVFCFGFPVLLKQFVLKPVRFLLPGDGTAGEIFQWGGSLFLIFGFYHLFTRLIEKRKADELSIRIFFPGFIKGALWGAGSIALILFLLYLGGYFRIVEIVRGTGSYNKILLLFLLSTTEEILYRGIIYKLIEKAWGILPALLVSSFLFSIMHITNNHYNPASFAAIILGGAMMGLMFSITRNLWWPVAAHFFWNFAQTIAGLTLSGMDEFNSLAFFRTRLTGPSLITGGDFGVENSLITILYTAVMTLILSILVFRKTKYAGREKN